MELDYALVYMNFFKLQQALHAAATNYPQEKKLSKSPPEQTDSFIKSLLWQPSDAQNRGYYRAENIRNITSYLLTRANTPSKKPSEITDGEKALLMITRALLISTSTTLRNLILPLLLKPTNNHGSLDKNLVFTENNLPPFIFQNKPSLDEYARLLLRQNISLVLNIALINTCAIDRLLTAPPSRSIAKSPLTLVCIKRLCTGTDLDCLPIDIIKIIVSYMHADIRTTLIRQIHAAAKAL